MEVPWARLEEKIDGVHLRLVGVQTAINSLDGRMTSLEGKVTSLDGKVTSLDGRVMSLGGQVMDLANEIHNRGVLLEAANNGIKSVAERTLSLRQAMDREFIEVLKRLDERVQPVEAASRYLATHVPAKRRRMFQVRSTWGCGWATSKNG